MTNRKMPAAMAVASVAVALLLIPAVAPAATFTNGDFEAGNLSGWQVSNSTSFGNWFAYTGDKPPIQKELEEEEPEIIEVIEPIKPITPSVEPLTPKFPSFFVPPQGSWGAVTDERRPDTAILFQDIALEPNWTHQLTMTFYYHSFAPIFVPSPDTLALPGPQIIVIGEEVEEKPTQQQVRVDVMKPTAPIESLNPSDILATLFASRTGDPQTMAPTQLSADLTPFAGQTVRLRIANAVNDEPFNVGVDAVSMTSTPPNNLFKKGKLKLNRSNGTGTLSVTVPGAGVLTLTDAAASKKATASRKKSKLVKPAKVSPKAAGTVKLSVKPTAAGKRIERKKGRLRIKASLSFTPTGGFARTESFKGTLKLTQK